MPRYVLGNGRKHSCRHGGTGANVNDVVDRFSSAMWFDGFRERLMIRGLERVRRPVAAARTWLLAKGWRRLGLLSVAEMPRS
ncbi:MAG: hypothetical protein AB8H80_13320 [Planctomycetota bacterium]